MVGDRRGSERAAWVWALCASALVGCASGTSVPGGCGSDEACPRGQICVEGLCQRDAPPVVATDGGRVDGQALDVAPPDTPDAAPDAGRPDGGECVPNETRLCGSGPSIGLCRRGMETCGPDGVFGPCAGAVGPADELCNGADDDCDTRVDEDLGLGDPCVGEGACGEGVVECRNARELRCSTEPGGSADASGSEACNRLDDDCDGMIDEDFGAGADCEGRCGPGLRECDAAGIAVCSTDPTGSEAAGRPEACDGFDNDCDGAVDEGFGLGEGCLGPGGCGPGVFECDDGGEARCSSAPGGSQSPASPEVCDGADDDCDGAIDEGLGVGVPCVGALPCDGGVTECGPGGRLRCSTDPGGSAEDGVERCNGLDDDCDGATDEGLELGAPCPALGQCPASTLACGIGEVVVCATWPGGPLDASDPETCDGRDEDCDGAVDEGLGLGGGCEALGICGAGLVECAADGATRCSSAPGGSADASIAEDCNQLDDDCDGRIDEGGVCGGEACAGGIALEPGVTAAGSTDGLFSDYARANCLGIAEGPDQVFRFDVPAMGPYVVGVAPLEPGYDPIFWIAGDCPGADRGQCLMNEAFQSEEGPGRPEAASLNFIRGGRFALIVDSRGAGGGPFVVRVGPPSAGESCQDAIPLTLPARHVDTTARRQANAAVQGCVPQPTVGPDLLFRFDLEAAARVRIAATSAARARLALAVSADCAALSDTCAGGVLAPAAGEPVELELELTPGPWFVLVDHPVQTGGAFALDVAIVE